MIKAGDTVWVARPSVCCGSYGKKGRGYIFVVDHVMLTRDLKWPYQIVCAVCRKVKDNEELAMVNAKGGYDVRMLEKFPDLKEDERVEECLTA